MIKSLILLVFLCGSSNALVLSTTACTTNFANANDCENALFSEYGTSGFYFLILCGMTTKQRGRGIM